jgi:hypothetical protein
VQLFEIGLGVFSWVCVDLDYLLESEFIGFAGDVFCVVASFDQIGPDVSGEGNLQSLMIGDFDAGSLIPVLHECRQHCLLHEGQSKVDQSVFCKLR